MSSETVNWEAIARYLAGESPAEEQAAVQQWLGNHPADAKAIAALDDVLSRLTPGLDAETGIDVEAALAAVKSKREKPDLSVIRGGAPRLAIPQRRSASWVALAAVAAGIVAIAMFSLRDVRSKIAPVPTTIAARTLTTPVGGRDSLVLPDGSQVIIGPGSVLTMAEGFGQTERRVTLHGEALFTVVHDQSKPFIVSANGNEIRDVGTAFSVHSDVGGVRVAVTQGVVELRPSATAAATTLKAGDLGTVSPAGDVTALHGENMDDDLAWTHGKLVFRDTPLSDVGEDLLRWYGVHIVVQDPALSRRPLSASFQGDSINSVLDVISRALGASMARRGDTVYLRSIPR